MSQVDNGSLVPMVTAGNTKAAPHEAGRWERRLFVAVAVVVAVWLLSYLRVSLGGWFGSHLGWDFTHYVAGAERWLAAGSPYEPRFVTGPYTFDDMAFVHPPIALPLFAAFTVLPEILWWVVPIGVVGWSIWSWRPSYLALTVIFVILALPLSLEKVLVGNSVMWCAALLALGLRFGWPSILLVIKPVFLPLALVGARRRSTWIAGGVVAVAAVAFGSLWLDWLEVLRNFSGQSILYSVSDLPLVLVPVVAWAARTGRSSPESG